MLLVNMFCFLPSTSQPLKMWPSHVALASWPVSLNTRQASDLAHNHELGSHVWLQLLPVNQKDIWICQLSWIACPVNENRVLKWWCHKNEISEIMGFVGIFWKNNVQEAYLPKMSISGQIVSEIVAQLSLENSIQTLLIFFWVDPKIIVLYEVCISCRPRLPLHLRFKKIAWQVDWRGFWMKM